MVGRMLPAQRIGECLSKLIYDVLSGCAARGLAEIPRYMLSIAGVEFEDFRYPISADFKRPVGCAVNRPKCTSPDVYRWFRNSMLRRRQESSLSTWAG